MLGVRLVYKLCDSPKYILDALLCKVDRRLRPWYILRMKDHSKATCPVAKVASLLSDAWTILILRDLMKKPLRFSELEDSLEGISSRTLTLKLEKLLTCGIIAKKDIHYSITVKGKKLGAIFDAMTVYGKRYLAR